MLINVKPIHDEALDCFHSIIASVAMYWNRECTLMFADSWGFIFKANDIYKGALIGNRLNPGCGGNVLCLLEKYHGIRVEWYSVKNAEECLSIIYNQNKKSDPVVISIDAYWCPWDIAYQKYHNTHYCLVIGVDENNENLICIDPYVSSNYQNLAIGDLKHGFKELSTFVLLSSWENDVDWYSILDTAVTNMYRVNYSNNAFDSMRNFAEAIADSLDFKREMEGCYDIHNVPLFAQLKIIDSCRINFANVLKYFSERYSINELYHISEDMRQAGNMWSKIRLKLMKLSILSEQKIQPTKIAEKIVEIADYEEKIAKELRELTKKN